MRHDGSNSGLSTCRLASERRAAAAAAIVSRAAGCEALVTAFALHSPTAVPREGPPAVRSVGTESALGGGTSPWPWPPCTARAPARRLHQRRVLGRGRHGAS